MKKTVTTIICLLVIISAFSQHTHTLNVMTYNLRFGELAGMDEFAEFIKSEQPDIVALQECDWKTQRERAPKQNGKTFINELAFYTEMFGIYGKAIDYKGGFYGVGILSRYPVVKFERVFLPNPAPAKEQRVMIIADIQLPDATIFTFICTHLEVSSAQKREAQIDFINEKVKEIQFPVILAGDLNAQPQDNEIKKGFSAWADMTNQEFTFPGLKTKIDYIYGFPADKMKMISTKVHNDIHLSDHFPVSSVIEIKTAK